MGFSISRSQAWVCQTSNHYWPQQMGTWLSRRSSGHPLVRRRLRALERWMSPDLPAEIAALDSEQQCQHGPGDLFPPLSAGQSKPGASQRQPQVKGHSERRPAQRPTQARLTEARPPRGVTAGRQHCPKPQHPQRPGTHRAEIHILSLTNRQTKPVTRCQLAGSTVTDERQHRST